jgi:hypothetical protein
MISRYRIFLLAVLILASVRSADAGFWMPIPPYPHQAREQNLQGTAVIKVTFSRFFEPPSKVELLKSTGYPVLDSAIVENAKKRWLAIYFTPAERKDRAAMNQRLLPLIPDSTSRHSIIQGFVYSKSETVWNLPVSKIQTVSFGFP